MFASVQRACGRYISLCGRERERERGRVSDGRRDGGWGGEMEGKRGRLNERELCNV